MQCNQISLSGLIVKLYPMRHTPSKVNIARFVLEHLSAQIEAGITCTVKCKMFCIWVAPKSEILYEGASLEVSGFMSQNAKLQLVLHVTKCLDKGN